MNLYIKLKKFSTKETFLCHAKNFEALINLKKINANYFWHQNDDYVLTSSGYVWTFWEKLYKSIMFCRT